LCAPSVFSGLFFIVCPYSFLWIVRNFVPLMFSLDCSSYKRAHNPEKTVGAHNKEHSRENRRGTQGQTIQKKTIGAHNNGHLRENRRSTQERTSQRKPYGNTRKDNPEKTVGANKGGKSRENRKGTQGQTTPYVFFVLSTLVCFYGFLWIVLYCVPLLFSLDCPPFCAPKIFSGLSSLVCPYRFLWVVCPCVNVRVDKKGQPRENRRETQGRIIQRKPKGHTRMNNPEKTLGAQNCGRPYRFLWVVCPFVPVRFSLGCPFLCSRTVFSGMSFLVCSYEIADNPEKTVGAHNKEQSRENRRGTQGLTIQRKL
jgi:hypothetical protein